MLDSYFQNQDVGMTKDQYFEMCEMLGSKPLDSEIPVEFEDFPDIVQQAFIVYNKLRDDWDTMNGVYMGKSYSGLQEIFEIYEIDRDSRKMFLDWFSTIDGIRRKLYDAKKPKT
jgi:hypothetical protein